MNPEEVGSFSSENAEIENNTEIKYDFDADLQPLFEVIRGIKFSSWLMQHPHQKFSSNSNPRLGFSHFLAVVFTDLVGSTKLLYEAGDGAYNKLLKTHYDAARKLIKLHQGYEINTTGDGFLCAFILTTDALKFALDLYKNPGDDKLAVRVGIHYGSTRVIDGNNVCGQTIHFASRVTSQASGSEIWVSDIAKSQMLMEQEFLERKSLHLRSWFESLSKEMEALKVDRFDDVDSFDDMELTVDKLLKKIKLREEIEEMEDKISQAQNVLAPLQWKEYSNCVLKGIPGEFCLWQLL